MIIENIAKSLFVAAQLPLDAKTHFATLNDMRNLGISNYKAFQYYEWMSVRCVEDGKKYVWKEVEVDFTSGVLPINFTYPVNILSNDIDYSLRTFNFVLESAVDINTNSGQYFICKFPNNLGSFLEVNDVAIGYFSSTKFGQMRYKGGPVNQITSWAFLDTLNPMTYE